MSFAKQSSNKKTLNQTSEENFFVKASAYGINSCEDRYSFVKEFNGLKKARGSKGGFSSRKLLAKPISDLEKAILKATDSNLQT